MATTQLTVQNGSKVTVNGLPFGLTPAQVTSTDKYIKSVKITNDDGYNIPLIVPGAPAQVQLGAGDSGSVTAELEPFARSVVNGAILNSPGKYITAVTISTSDVSYIIAKTSGYPPDPAYIPYGDTASIIIDSKEFEKTHVAGAGATPPGKMITGITLDGVDMLSESVADLAYGDTTEIVPTYSDIPTVSATFSTSLDTEKAYTSVHLVVTHSDGTSESVTGDYTFQNGDQVSIVGTEYVAPGPTYDNPTITVPQIGSTVKITAINVDGQPNTTPGAVVKLPESSHVDVVTQVIAPPKIVVPVFDPPMSHVGVKLTGQTGEITNLNPGTYMLDGSGQTISMTQEEYVPAPVYVDLPTIPAGDMVTDFTLAGSSQGQSAALEPGETYGLEITTEEYAVEVNVNYTNTTVPDVNPAGGE